MTDPYDRSNQPMVDLVSGNIIVFNGEVYNFKDIKKRLISSGITFNTESDTEVILKALSFLGPKIIADFEGMFAFSFYDKKSNKLIIARDYLGKKPLYYFLGKHKFFFSSQVRIINNYLKNLKINFQAVNTYLHLGYLVDPETMFKNVLSVKPGEIITLDLNTLSIESSINFIPKSIVQPDGSDLSINFDRAIAERTEGHKKFAISLSGGVDSSLIAMECIKLGLNADAYTMNWKTSDKEKYGLDAKQAKIISKELGINHKVIEMPSAKAIPLIVDEFVSAMDQPNANASGISMMYLYSQISKDGHRLVLTGDGSDEVFGGYDRYRLINKSIKIPKFHSLLLKNSVTKSNFKFIRQISNILIPTNIPEFWLFWHLQTNKKALNRLWENESDPSINLYGDELIDIYGNSDKNASSVMFKDLRTWLSMESNRKLDCVSMWYSIEARSPFQSENIIGQGYKNMKSSNFLKVKKESLYEAFPQLKNLSILKEKTGFVSPLGYWLRNNDELIDYSINSISEFLPLNKPELARLRGGPKNSNFNDIKMLWSLIILNKWFVKNV
jgi:asparagine synthase (glutamine-hydrolysing)